VSTKNARLKSGRYGPIGRNNLLVFTITLARSLHRLDPMARSASLVLTVTLARISSLVSTYENWLASRSWGSFPARKSRLGFILPMARKCPLGCLHSDCGSRTKLMGFIRFGRTPEAFGCSQKTNGLHQNPGCKDLLGFIFSMGLACCLDFSSFGSQHAPGCHSWPGSASSSGFGSGLSGGSIMPVCPPIAAM